jgi:hypothetical protein
MVFGVALAHFYGHPADGILASASTGTAVPTMAVHHMRATAVSHH